LCLRMTAQAKIWVALRKHLLIDRAVGIVTDSAAFAHGFVFEDKWTRLLAMALLAAFVLPCHGQSTFRLENVAPVRIVALDATHVTFNDRMMLRQAKFRLNVRVTLKTGCRIISRVDDEFGAAARLDVFAAGTVTGFATCASG